MDERALLLVRRYIEEHLDKSDDAVEFEVYTVWKSKVLQNWKYLISSTLPDGMYYEMTYDGDKNVWYLDAYKKFENRTIATMTHNEETGFDEATADIGLRNEPQGPRSCRGCKFSDGSNVPICNKCEDFHRYTPEERS